MRCSNEKNISTKEAAEKQSAWIPQAHVHQERTQRLETPPGEGQKKADRVKSKTAK